MDSRKITEFIKKANRRLKLQHMGKTLQIALCSGLAAALLVLVISRLFVFPYYGFYVYAAAGLGVFIHWLWNIRAIPRRKQAITELDKYTPHNQLLTLSQLPHGNHLAADLAARIEKEIHISYQLFKKEKNEWFLPKWLLTSIVLAILLIISGLFPASTQLEAKEHEQEQELIEEMIEKVEQQKEQAKSPVVKKEMENLEEKLKDSETPEQALRELVKKQKELELQKQKKMQEETEQANEEAKDLSDASAKLAEQAGKTQTALSEMGKPVASDLQQALAANDLSADPEDSNETERDPESESASESENGADGQQSDSAGSGEGEGAGDSAAGDEGSESAEGEGNGEGEGEG
ncbi:hypothetical protein, partial [Planococcus sp. CAU13]|uniref:hypothetical protein n=1 Tax=Planococcus sp. CAU13 TaxID=1541197 RepID=UPI00052FE0FA